MTLNNTKKKVIAIVSIIAVLVGLMLLDLVPGLSAKAASAEGSGDIGYYVRAVLPENQMDDTLTYFDLRMQPGATQTLEVEVVNDTNEDITVDVAAISASTNRNGIIDYKTPGIRDKTLAIPFSEIAALETGSVTVPAGGTAPARVTVAMPNEAYDGVVLGGLVFTRRPAGDGDGASGMTLQNVYSYVLGVKLSETDAVVLPGFELESVKAETVNYEPALVHTVRNTEAAIAKGIDLHIVVRDADGNVVGELERSGIDMAPNSVMPLGVTPVAGGTGGTGGSAQPQSPGQLVAGDYTSEVTLGHGGETWTFEQKFTVGSIEAENINAETIGTAPETLPADSKAGMDPMMLVIIIAAAAIIVALLVIILLLARRKKDERDDWRIYRRP